MAAASPIHVCAVKYIDIDLVDPTCLHTATAYELCIKPVQHTSYEEMHEAVFTLCPDGYDCKEPIALYHEVLWACGLRWVNADGEKDGRLERDELHHAIEEGEYKILFGSPATAPLSVCVDVVKRPDSAVDSLIFA